MSGRPPPTPAAGSAGEVQEENWSRRKKLVVSCHQTARNGAFYKHQAHTSRSNPESAAMPDRPAGQERELLTIVEAAELLRAPVATLRYWRHLGTGPRSFRRVLYRTDDLRNWVDAQHGQVANDPGSLR